VIAILGQAQVGDRLISIFHGISAIIAPNHYSIEDAESSDIEPVWKH
jgi:hypothetical protein